LTFPLRVDHNKICRDLLKKIIHDPAAPERGRIATGRRNMKKIFVVNLGSTSTKVAYFEDQTCLYKENLKHPAEEIKRFSTVWDQFDYRKAAVDAFLDRHNIRAEELDAFVTRGGHTEPLSEGTYQITEKMLEQSRSMRYGNHVADLGLLLAAHYAERGPLPFTVDTACTDEFEPLARYSGLREIPRVSRFHVLNQKAVARKYAADAGRNYEDLNLIVCHMGGGTSVAVHKHGKMVDADNGLDGDGPFSTNRSCGLPVGALIDLCYSGQYSHAEMKRKVNGLGGLMSYIGETDVAAAEQRAQNGDEACREALLAMCYQTAKEIAGMAGVVCGEVDAILITGGIAHSAFLMNEIRRRVEFIAPVRLYPGEFEMESLGLGTYRALTGEVKIKTL
jgi:butyrate kinase